MPIEEGLKISITGDASSLEKASSNAAASLDKVDKAASRTSASISNLQKSIGASASSAQSKVKGLALTVETLQAKIQARKDFILRETDLTKIAKYNREISSLESVLVQIKNTGKDGFWSGKPIEALQKKTGETVKNVAGLGGSFTNLLGPLSKAYSGLRLVANILPGVGIGGLIGFAVGPIISFAQSLFGAGEEAETAGKKIKEAETTIQSLAASTAGSSVAAIERLRIGLTNVTLSTDQRKKALQEYNDVAAKSNQLTLSDLSNLTKVNGAIDRQIELLKIRALIKGSEDKLAEAFKSIFESQFKINALINKSNPQLEDAARLYSNAGKEQKDFISGLTFSQSLGLDLNKSLKVDWRGNLVNSQQLGLNVFRARKEAEGSADAVQDITRFMNTLIGRADDFGGAFEGTNEKIKKTKKELKKLIEPIGHIDFSFHDLAFKIPAEEIRATQAAAEEVSKDIRTVVENTLSKQTIVARPNIVTPTTGKGGIFAGVIEGMQRDIVRLDDVKRDLDAKVQSFNKGLEALKESSKEAGAIGLGESLGKALATGDLSGIFRSIASTLGDFISQIGQLLIKEAIAIKAFKEAFKGLLKNPVAAIGVGIGLVAIGAAIKNIVLPQPKGFAQGAIVSGPVFGMVGEGRGTSRANPEVISPLDKLKNLIGSNDNFPQFLPVHELSGDTLRLWYQRANTSGRMFQ